MRGFVENDLCVERLIYYPTLRCNLRCAMCSAYSPYYQTPYHPPIEQLCREIDKIFEIVDQIELIEIVGGEPMIRKDLDILLRQLRQYMPRIERIRLTTNGTVLPDDSFIFEAKALGDKFSVLIDDYGPDLSKKAADIHKLLCLSGIRSEIRDNYQKPYGGGWWNLGDFSQLWNDKEAKSIYKKCVIGKNIRTMNYINGKIFQCAAHRRAVELKIVPENDTEVINLFDISATRKLLRQRIAEVYDLPVLSACKYCPGRIKEAKRYPPAVQLSPIMKKKE